MKKINFLNDLENTPFQNVYSFTDPDEAMEYWTKLFKNVLDKHCPLKSKRVKNNKLPPWLTTDIQKEMHKRKN